MKVSKLVYIYHVQYSRSSDPNFVITETKVDEDGDWTLIGEQLVSFEVDETIDYRDRKIAGLQAEKKKVRAKMQSELTVIEGRIQELLAITNQS